MEDVWAIPRAKGDPLTAIIFRLSQTAIARAEGGSPFGAFSPGKRGSSR